MSRRRIDPNSDSELELASYSNLTSTKRKRGRKPIEQEIPQERRGTAGSNAGDHDFSNLPLPYYEGNPNQEEIDHNLMTLPEVRLGGKSQNDFLREWVPRRSEQLHTLLEMEGPNNPNSTCEGCGQQEGIWRCKHCIGQRMLCSTCLKNGHLALPYHHVEQWNGRFFLVGALWQVGLKIHLGHKGRSCPETGPSEGATATPSEGVNAEEQQFGMFYQAPTDFNHTEYDQAEDEEDEEAWVFAEDETSLQSGPKPPATDGQGNSFISVVDVTGVHSLPVVHCRCKGLQTDPTLDYFKMGLFPASFSRIRTAFTLDVLRDFRLSNLECKTSAYQYYQRIRRLTSPAFPRTVINRYRELRRVSRQYRNLILWKVHGKVYDEAWTAVPPTQEGVPSTQADWDMTGETGTLPPADRPGPETDQTRDTRGSLAIFCAACPQPGINIPDNWMDDPNSHLYTRSLVADGNFKADHLNQKNEADDVHLTNGEAFMTAAGPYNEHIKEATRLAPRYSQKPTCNNHHANSDSDKAVNGKRVRGVGAHACARHGCFCPSSVVDFTKGEKQMHMDWSLVQAMETTNMKELIRLLHLYDVNCQFAIHLRRRLLESTRMSWPDTLKIISGIGLFHVHGHKDECLYRFASTYIPGVGIIDGEILETLWSILNETSRSTRGATTAHRTEVLDDHMGDSNWKKNINMAVTIGKKYLRAVAQERSSLEYFEDIEASTPPDVRETWLTEILAAERGREHDFKAMDIMQSKNHKLPTRKEIEVELGARELRNKSVLGSAVWIGTGLELEKSQYVAPTAVHGKQDNDDVSRFELRAIVRRYGIVPTTNQSLEIVKKRRRMKQEIEDYVRLSTRFMGVKAMDDLSTEECPVLDDDVDDGEVPDLQNATITLAHPERQPLPFPSGTSNTFRTNLPSEDFAKLKGLLKVEIKMRAGDANDCLERIRNDLIQLSWQFKYQVRANKTQNTKTKTWAGVGLLRRDWKLNRLMYNRNRFAMGAAGGEGEELVRKAYPHLEITHCVASAGLSDPNTPGQSSRRLTWLWQGVGFDEDLRRNDYALEFWRVNWMTARAQHNRWMEELQLTKKEMQWTVRFYMHMAKKWQDRRERAPTTYAGHIAYAEKQINMWTQLAKVAETYFKDLGCNYASVM